MINLTPGDKCGPKSYPCIGDLIGRTINDTIDDVKTRRFDNQFRCRHFGAYCVENCCSGGGLEPSVGHHNEYNPRVLEKLMNFYERDLDKLALD
uniref:CSON003203 protein n=1 Tax=Culicoides sonorensis TaxID=179676 RepID=A0A336MYT2_CULSO